MVYYHANGRVVQAHEDYLEQQAQKEANDETKLYIDQIDVCKLKEVTPSTAEVQIIVDAQAYRTLYCERAGDHCEDLESFRQAKPYPILETVDRNTLRTCSTFAHEYFTYNPEENELHLPVCYPRQHHAGRGHEPIAAFDNTFNTRRNGKRLAYPIDHQMAFIRPKEIEEYIVPWLKRVQRQFKGEGKRTGEMTKLARYLVSRSDPPIAMELPDALVDKLHLYNAMIQLGLPKFVQLPLVDKLVLQMYQTSLHACHLDTLEHTIGRFYSKGVAVLDPVLNHFIGTYSSRSLRDRTEPEPSGRNAKSADHTNAAGEKSTKEIPEELSTESEAGQAANEEKLDSTPERMAKRQTDPELDSWRKRRKYLDFVDHSAGRADCPCDTYILPPELPVLGHSIRHWSGVRHNQSTAAAHTGFPLNIGKYKKFIRRNSTDAIDVEDCYEEDTNRLAGWAEYLRYGPGIKP
ncbi:hypothetical protein G6011_08897 [Alternaria panax]|uniref:Uncharacterized protein n=1 Tax=Alternaria panax TaxID=48097 RepID=A0AAD4NP23_9PLEO|nr:hypothetical protein G6011_08897 [Alternaria panax]